MSSVSDPDNSRGQTGKSMVLKSEIYKKMYKSCAKDAVIIKRVFNIVKQNNSLAICIQTGQIQRPA
jgi:hypothetical protein